MIDEQANIGTSRLELRDIHFGYTRHERVIAGLSLHVEAGQVHCILGPSGCGKSTLLRLICGLERLASGSILISDRIVADQQIHLPPERRRVGLVFQDYALFPNLTVRQNIQFGVRAKQRATRNDVANRFLALVNMSQYSDRMPHTLSGGQQQRVALARALANEPRVMLLDEPFSGLDSELRAALRTELLELLQSSQIATLMVTHDPQEADAVADHVTWMRPP